MIHSVTTIRKWHVQKSLKWREAKECTVRVFKNKIYLFDVQQLLLNECENERGDRPHNPYRRETYFETFLYFEYLAKRQLILYDVPFFE